MNPYLLSALAILSFMSIVFCIAQLKDDNSIADVAWGIGFIIVAYLTLWVYGDKRVHQKIVSFMVLAWGARLSMYILVRSWGRPEDFRYAKWRVQWGKSQVWRSFLQVFMLQGALMWVVALPVMIVNNDTVIHHSYKYLYPVACVIWAIGFFIEGHSDYQMFMFKNDTHPHRAHVMNKGLWKYSRHPNYFGETLMWWAIFLFSIPSGLWYVAILSPLTITFLLLKVSGVTMLEKKYEGDDEYTRYKRSTSAFVLWFPKKENA